MHYIRDSAPRLPGMRVSYAFLHCMDVTTSFTTKDDQETLTEERRSCRKPVIIYYMSPPIEE